MDMRVLCRLRQLWIGMLALLCVAVAGRVEAQNSASAPHLKVTLLADRTAAGFGAQPTHLGLLFDLEPGWHVYWSNAGDSGEPPAVTWTLPAGVTAAPLEFPAPKRLPLGPLMDFGYEHQVLFPAKLTIATDRVTNASLPIGADVSWLVCRQACIPGKAHLALSLPWGQGNASASAPLFAKYFAAMPKPLPPSAKAVFSSQPDGLHLALLTGSRVRDPQYFPFEQNVIADAAPQPVTARRDGAEIVLKRDEALRDAPATLHGVVLLRDGTAYEVRAPLGVIPAMPVPPASGWWHYAAFALLGGVILNLMPCVFPVLFIKALALVQSSTADRRAMRTQGLMYTLGILVSFWIVVGVLLVLRAGGRQLGWGFQFQSPMFVAMIAMLLFFFALSLAGMFEIGLSVTGAGSSLANKQGLAGSFFTGVLAMVVATPCTAPFMGAAIGFALAQSAAVTFAVFTALGVGLALPYLLLAFQPAWTRLLPRPGAWMEVLKQATAVPIFATVIWLVWLFVQTAGTNALLALLGGFLLLAIAGWVLGRWPARRPATLAALIVMGAAIAAPVYALRSLPAPQQSAAAGRVDHTRRWEPFTPEVVAKYQAQGRPVFIDFTADWCLSCQVNERVVLERPEVLGKLEDGRIALVRADWTRHDEAIARALAVLGRSGVPTYALYPGRLGAPAQVLPEVLTTSAVLDALKALPETGAASAQGAP